MKKLFQLLLVVFLCLFFFQSCNYEGLNGENHNVPPVLNDYSSFDAPINSNPPSAKHKEPNEQELLCGCTMSIISMTDVNGDSLNPTDYGNDFRLASYGGLTPYDVYIDNPEVGVDYPITLIHGAGWEVGVQEFTWSGPSQVHYILDVTCPDFSFPALQLAGNGLGGFVENVTSLCVTCDCHLFVTSIEPFNPADTYEFVIKADENIVNPILPLTLPVSFDFEWSVNNNHEMKFNLFNETQTSFPQSTVNFRLACDEFPIPQSEVVNFDVVVNQGNTNVAGVREFYLSNQDCNVIAADKKK